MQEKTADKIRGYIFTPKEARMLFCFHQNRQKSLIFIIQSRQLKIDVLLSFQRTFLLLSQVAFLIYQFFFLLSIVFLFFCFLFFGIFDTDNYVNAFSLYQFKTFLSTVFLIFFDFFICQQVLNFSDVF